ncbi:MAG: hypothetical protein KKA79_02635 [Nanoarchaeota archaeon]|nr:hypothetical protein [Nanoarchaeota archaeon]MCG2717827.1 hypothetical protein [Nanoarchaeota archaeon]
MVNQDIIDYVKTELKRGVTEDKLRHVLMGHGWPEFEINEAFEKVKAEQVQEKPKEPAKPKDESYSPSPAEIIEQAKAETKKAIENQKPAEGVKPEVAGKKSPILGDVKNIVTNKIFIIAAIVILLGTVSAFVLPSLFEGSEGSPALDASDEAKNTCQQYCNSGLCGFFINPEFSDPELEGKSCLDIGVKCPQQNDCTAEYP